MKRRKFIKNLGAGSTGIILLGSSAGSCISNSTKNEGLDILTDGFINLPDSAKPHTWWHWREGRINEEAITAELEAMKEIGLAGVTLFSTNRMGETGEKVPALSPKWYDKVKYALKECDRLGLTFNFHNCPGWNGSGGPWITPDKSMMHVVSSKHEVEGGKTLELECPPSWPEKGTKYYRDIAVLAFPAPAVYNGLQELPKPNLTSNFIEKPDQLYEAQENNKQKEKLFVKDIEPGKLVWVQFEFPSAVTCRSVKILGSRKSIPDEHRAIVLASEDGKNYQEVVRLSSYYSLFHRRDASVTHAIPATTARYFRLQWDGPATLELNQVLLSSTPVINSHYSKTGELGKTFISEPKLVTEEGTAVLSETIRDITDQLDANKKLSWTAPEGEPWIVTRIGYENKGIKNAPAAPEATGLQCDKFDPETIAYHFDQYAGRILKEAETIGSKSVRSITFDSWEANSQNWSPVFRDEFKQRMGYDVLKYLPTFAGFIVEDRELTDRFLRDIRQTMSDLTAENFFGGMTKIAHKHGLKVYAEDAGGGGETMVSDPVQHYLYVDVPMNEFGNTLKYAASSANIKKQQVVAMEVYTGLADWGSYPGSLKSKGDMALSSGVNQFVFHTYAHTPEVDKIYPGATFGPYGLAFTRGQTWWEMGSAWISYLTRCQFMLQQGRRSTDVLYFYGEEVGGPVPMVLDGGNDSYDKRLELPYGYDYDLLPAETLINDLTFKEGKLYTSAGASYKLLVLRGSDKMSPEAAKKIKELVYAGATVLGPRPNQSPGLTAYPQCDQIVEEIGKEVWGNCDGKIITQHSYGKGQVYSGVDLREVLNTMSISPDFGVENQDNDRKLRYLHRYTDDTDIYFISNGKSTPVSFTAKFRVSGKKPVVWDPVTGVRQKVQSFDQDGTQTTIPMYLDANASVFVVFNKSASNRALNKTYKGNPELNVEMTLTNPWDVSFSKGWGAPEQVRFEKLEDWSKRPEKAIKYYSGTADYQTEFNWDKPLSGEVYIDLGKVEVIAGVKLNGKECGISWTPPYRVELTGALKQGKNVLEIKVANTWINRLMGDGKGIEMGAEKHSWTTSNPFTVDPKYAVPEISKRFIPLYKDVKEPIPSGLLGPVRILTKRQN